MEPVSSREVIRSEDLIPAPEAVQRELEAVAASRESSSTRASVYEIKRLIDAGVDPIRHYTEKPQYAEANPGRQRNLLSVILANGSPETIRWILSGHDLSKVRFSGWLGEKMIVGLLKKNSPGVVRDVIAAGLRVDDFCAGILDKTVPAPVMSDEVCIESKYRSMIDGSQVLTMVDALRAAGGLDRPDAIFMALMDRQKRLRQGTSGLLAYTCGGLDAGWLSGLDRRRLSLALSHVIGGYEQYVREMRYFGFPGHRVGPCQNPEVSCPAVYVQAVNPKGGVLPRLFLDSGYDINERNGKGRTLIAEAVYRNDVDAVNFLIASGADLSVVDGKGASLLHIASNASLGVVDALYRAGAPVDLRNETGWTPLAGGSNSAKYLNYLCGRSIPEGETLAMLAVRDSSPELLQKALDQGDDINALSDIGWGVSDIVIREFVSNPTLWRMMAQAGFDLDRSVDASGVRTPLLHRASANDGEIQRSMVSAMVGAGADVDIKNEQGATALHLAIREGHMKMVELLLELGADSTIKCGKTSTLQMTRDPEMKRLLTACRTGQIISDAMGGDSSSPSSVGSDSMSL